MPRFTLLWSLPIAGLLTAAHVAELVLLRLPQAGAEPPRPDLNRIHGRRALDAGDRILLGRNDLRISQLGSSS